jgi:hypothetical protein
MESEPNCKIYIIGNKVDCGIKSVEIDDLRRIANGKEYET